VVKGSGIQFMGDHICRFKKGDLILVGSNLPHYWRCDSAYFQENSKLKAIATVAHFREDFWGPEFLNLPENKPLKTLLQKARRGISIGGKTREEVKQLMDKMLEADSTDRLIYLLLILKTIAKSRHLKILSSEGFVTSYRDEDTDRINKIYNYSLAHFKSKITLQEIAEVANISPHSFCRYFKAQTRRTFNHFLLELRVGHASKLLIEKHMPIAQAGYESGFNNMANFYKAFRKITGKTPLAFQKEYHQQN
jgi:AraC-like DNA-binding protein